MKNPIMQSFKVIGALVICMSGFGAFADPETTNEPINATQGGSSLNTSNAGQCGRGTCPSKLHCPAGQVCGCEIVDGLGANKRAYLAAGADLRFLASAMMETRVMDTNYIYGDDKIDDSFNAGATKQNWGMMRQCNADWASLTPEDYAWSDDMNDNRGFDVQIYRQCREHFGAEWFAGHRNGEDGITNPDTDDIDRFKESYYWTLEQLLGNECNDVRFWVDLVAI